MTDHLTTADVAGVARSNRSEVDDTAAGSGPGSAPGGPEAPPLFERDDVTRLRTRWQEVQTGFVDDPRRAVHEADELVAAVISSLSETFARHKGELEAQWREGEPATEELRIALRRYRSFFDQLLGT
ncbi:hypothetical protein [Amycolatopsis sp. FDAARGOS 1241]|uniref:hypothetical protein n=1 Tax=Amycolatopsis sp. FDAARGOS 1241 TaxID=2778070 RepID=UPI001EF3228C|nr:hypothetical protein [Amycolatopsis sp. FDAARGOS 1241]